MAISSILHVVTLTVCFALLQPAYAKLFGSSFGVPGVNKTFDYVIVGAGPGGSTVATRLAESGKFSVALIEAGSFYEFANGNRSQVPLYVYHESISGAPGIDWGFITQPQTGLNNRKIAYKQGKALGGSSARNQMYYNRGTVGVYQRFADAVDDQSYTFGNFLPYLAKSVNFTEPNMNLRAANSTVTTNSSAWIDGGGPLHVSYSNYAYPLSSYAPAAFNLSGIPPRAGFEDGGLIGSGYFGLTIDPTSETRSSAQTSFLDYALENTELQIYQSTMAKKILFDSNKKATGVSVTSGTSSFVLTATKEVIVSAGPFHSPQLLMVSGIGPKATLEGLGIDVISELPGVGVNFWDHTAFAIEFEVKKGLTTNTGIIFNSATKAAAEKIYLDSQTGPLTNSLGDYVAFEKLPDAYLANLTTAAQAHLASFPDDWPHLELLVTSTSAAYSSTKQYGALGITLVAPSFRSNMTISSADTNDLPIINPNWMGTDIDLDVAVQAVKRGREIIVNFGDVIGDEYSPGKGVETDEEIAEWIKTNVIAIHHSSAACRMGPPNDTTSVLDSKGQVYGVTGVRVVDVSAFPFTPPGHVQASVYGLAEKIADVILTGS